MPEFQQANKIMFYASFDNEVYTHDLIKELIFQEKKIFLPYIYFGEMFFSYVNSFDELRKGRYGILEPKIIRGCSAFGLNMAIVPGIAFDKNNNRIGYGFGYYDKLFKKIKCPKVALAYDFQIIEKIETDSYDIPLDKIISD